MNTASDLSVNHHFCAIISPYPIKQIGNIYIFVISNQKNFIPQILKVVRPFGKSSFILVSWELKYKKLQFWNLRVRAPLIQSFLTMSNR